MSRRLFALLTALLLLCAGLNGLARAAVVAGTATEPAVIAAEVAQSPFNLPPPDEKSPAEPTLPTGSDRWAESIDGPLLPLLTDEPPILPGRHLLPRPVLQKGHPAPWLAGLLRPPSHPT
jgi:hypothetical protein